VAPGVHEAELAYLGDQEWACTGEDVLWRRSKLGLHLSADDALRIDAWMARRAGLPTRGAMSGQESTCN
jgi:glycerol-3-phosphate dehydrogenase